MDKRIANVVLGLTCAAFGCGDNQDPDGAHKLWEEIRAQNYRSWQRAPGYAERRASGAPHSDAVDIFVNDVVDAALRAQALSSWPLGSLIVKDGWDGDALELVAVMEKRASGWYWAEYDASGDPAFSGTPSLCIGCHESGDDFVRAFAFARSAP